MKSYVITKTDYDGFSYQTTAIASFLDKSKAMKYLKDKSYDALWLYRDTNNDQISWDNYKKKYYIQDNDVPQETTSAPYSYIIVPFEPVFRAKSLEETLKDKMGELNTEN